MYSPPAFAPEGVSRVGVHGRALLHTPHAFAHEGELGVRGHGRALLLGSNTALPRQEPVWGRAPATLAAPPVLSAMRLKDRVNAACGGGSQAASSTHCKGSFLSASTRARLGPGTCHARSPVLSAMRLKNRVWGWIAGGVEHPRTHSLPQREPVRGRALATLAAPPVLSAMRLKDRVNAVHGGGSQAASSTQGLVPCLNESQSRAGHWPPRSWPHLFFLPRVFHASEGPSVNGGRGGSQASRTPRFVPCLDESHSGATLPRSRPLPFLLPRV